MRGFVLTLDIALAVLILGIFLVVLNFELSNLNQPNYLFRTSSDLLTVMDKFGVLKNISSQTTGQAQTTLALYLNSLPQNIGANITVDVYDYVSNDFNLKTSLNYLRGSAKQDRVTLKRVFMENSKGEYGLATLEMWYE